MPSLEIGLDVNADTDAVVAQGWPLLIRAAVISPDGQPVKRLQEAQLFRAYRSGRFMDSEPKMPKEAGWQMRAVKVCLIDADPRPLCDRCGRPAPATAPRLDDCLYCPDCFATMLPKQEEAGRVNT